MADGNEPVVKLLIIGESSVGKSCLLLRFAENKFTESFLTTMGIDFKIRRVEIGGAKIKLQIWDTAGQEKFRTITRAYYRGAHGILLVYDVTSRDTFGQSRQWMQSIQDNMAEPVAIVFAGNKCDLERRVDKGEAEAFAREFNVEYFEISAKSGDGVEDTFMHLATKVVEGQKDRIQVGSPGVAVPKQRKKGSSAKGGCCP
jgi:small GTP-binding protein